MVNIYDITCDDIDRNTLEDKLSNLRDMIPSRIQIIENANKKQDLRSKLRDKIHAISS